MNKYRDIINLPHHEPTTRPRMSRQNRAAQFSAFAALDGYEEEIDETARLTDKKRELSEDGIAAINESLQTIMSMYPERPCAAVTYFVPDSRKSGGAYACKTGFVKQIDEGTRRLVFADDTAVPIEDIRKLELLHQI